MRTYLIHHNSKGRIITIDAANTSADEYGRMQEAFATEARGGKEPKDVYEKYADMITLYPDCVVNGLPYSEELAGPSGASFLIIAGPDATPEQIKGAKSKLYRDRDVVHLSVLRYRTI